MRFTVSKEQQKFFNINGYLEVEELLEKPEAKGLATEIKNVHLKSPGYPQDNLFRSIPRILNLIKKNGWGHVCADLLYKKQLRIFSDHFYETLPETVEFEEEDCALLVDLNKRTGCFFKNYERVKSLFAPSEHGYFLVVFTTRFLPNGLNPIVITL